MNHCLPNRTLCKHSNKPRFIGFSVVTQLVDEPALETEYRETVTERNGGITRDLGSDRIAEQMVSGPRAQVEIETLLAASESPVEIPP